MLGKDYTPSINTFNYRFTLRSIGSVGSVVKALFWNANHVRQQAYNKQQKNPFLDFSGVFPRIVS